MARGKLKGITIQLDAETTGLSKALAGVNRQARETQGELRQVDRLLKFDPKSTELLAQKQTLVAKRIENTKNKLTTLRQAQAQVEQQFKDGEIGEEAYREFQREIIKTEQELVRLESIGRKSAAEVSASMQAAGTKIKRVADNIGAFGRSMTMSVTMPLAAAGAVAVKTFADFEQTMNMVRVNTGATGREFAQLSDLALKMGADTVFSANESAQAMLELSKGGLKPADIEAGALAATMNLAATEGLALDQAATIVVRTMKTFNLNGKESVQVVDALAASSLASTADVEGIADAFKYVGSTAAQMKVPLVDVATGIAMVTDAGIDGTTAGTSYNRFLLGLAGTTKKGSKVIEEYGLQFFDANGRMRPTIEIVGELQRAFGGLNDQQRATALKDLFGVEGMRTANVLITQGIDGYQNYRSEVEQTGAAAMMADARMSGLKGALEQMAGSTETAAILIGEDLAPAVRFAADAIGDLADTYAAMPDSAQKTVLTLAEIAAVVGPTVWVFSSLAGAVGSTTSALGWVVGASVKSAAAVGTSGAAAGTAATEYGALATASGQAATGLGTVGATAPTAAGGMALLGRAVFSLPGLFAGILIKLEEFRSRQVGGIFADLAEKVGLSADAGDKFGRIYNALISGPFSMIGTTIGLAGDKLKEMTLSHKQAGDATSGHGDKAEQATDAIGGLSGATQDYAEAAGDAAGETTALTRSLEGVNVEADTVEGNMRLAADAMRDYREAMLNNKDAAAEVKRLEKEGKKGTEEWTRAVLAAEEAHQRLNDSRGENLDAIHDLNVALVTGSSKTENLTTEQSQLIGELDKASGRVAKLKGKLDTVPKSKRAKIEAEIEKAEKDLEKIKAKIAGVKGKSIQVRVSFAGSGSIKRAVVDGKLTGWVVNRHGGMYDQPTAALIGETYEREYVINAALLARGDRRQRSLLASLLEYSTHGRRASGPATSSGGDMIVNNYGLSDMDAAVTIATKRAWTQAQPIGRYSRGTR